MDLWNIIPFKTSFFDVAEKTDASKFGECKF